MNDAFVSEFTIPADHPALAGHFPGHPVVPGVVLLDEVYAAIREREPLVMRSIPVAKFLNPVHPGERIEVRLRFGAASAATVRVDFLGRRAATAVFEGAFVLTGDAP
jgi:3-hydroxymyristoyl/3-hydroxydecanoyl-(acyl carrier protein) dehydratase